MYRNIKRIYNINIKESIPNDCKEVFIAVHGFAGDKESSAISKLMDALYKENIGVVALDLPGHGVSEANGEYLTIDNCLNDINEILTYAKNKYNCDLSLFATSFGGYLSLLNITRYKNNFKNVILRCPAIKMDEILIKEIIGNQMFDEFTDCVFGYERELLVKYDFYKDLVNNKILDIFEGKTDNMLIIHGDNDDTAPVNDAIDFSNKYNVMLKIIEGADHRFKKPGELETVIKYTIEFINRKQEN